MTLARPYTGHLLLGRKVYVILRLHLCELYAASHRIRCILINIGVFLVPQWWM